MISETNMRRASQPFYLTCLCKYAHTACLSDGHSHRCLVHVATLINVPSLRNPGIHCHHCPHPSGNSSVVPHDPSSRYILDCPAPKVAAIEPAFASSHMKIVRILKRNGKMATTGQGCSNNALRHYVIRKDGIIITSTEGSSYGDAAPRLPAEIWENILGHISAGKVEHQHRHFVKIAFVRSVLKTCALVCKEWRRIAQYYLRQHIYIDDRTGVLSLYKHLRQQSCLRSNGGASRLSEAILCGSSGPIPYLGTFAAMLAGRLPHLTAIGIYKATWSNGSIRTEDIRPLAAFRSMDTLTLCQITFFNVSQLEILVSSLPGLTTLACDEVRFKRSGTRRPPQAAAIPPLHRTRLRSLRIRDVPRTAEQYLFQLSHSAPILHLQYDFMSAWVHDGDEAKGLRLPEGWHRPNLTFLHSLPTSLESLTFDFVHTTTGAMTQARYVPYTLGRRNTLSHLPHLETIRFRIAVTAGSYLRLLDAPTRILSILMVSNCTIRVCELIFVTSGCCNESVVFAELLEILQTSDALASIDLMLQNERFSTIEPCAFRIIVDVLGKGDALASRALDLIHSGWCRFRCLVRDMMPESNARGILATRIMGSYTFED